MLSGPRVQVIVGLGRQFVESLLARGEPVPEPIVGDALIDTGAVRTCVDDQVARQLRLPVLGRANLSTASHASIQTNMHPVKIEFVGSGLSSNILQAPACSLASQKLAILIGRDVLQQFLLVYNGPLGQWTMTLAHP